MCQARCGDSEIHSTQFLPSGGDGLHWEESRTDLEIQNDTTGTKMGRLNSPGKFRYIFPGTRHLNQNLKGNNLLAS